REAHMSTSNSKAAYLAPQHLADLMASGLTPQTIAACGFHTVSGAEVNRLLGWRGGGEKLGPCLAIPFYDLDGRQTGFARLKPDRPRAQEKENGEERLVKYEQPKGVPIRPYFPLACWSGLTDARKPLLITEGEKKAAKAAQEG